MGAVRGSPAHARVPRMRDVSVLAGRIDVNHPDVIRAGYLNLPEPAHSPGVSARRAEQTDPPARLRFILILASLP